MPDSKPKTTKPTAKPVRKPSARKPAVKTPTKAQRKTTPAPANTLRPEIISIICMACGLLLMLSLYNGEKAGVFGVFINDLLTGLFGFGAYLSPLLIIGVSLIVMLGRNKQIAPSKLVVSGVLFWCAIAFVHVRGGASAAAAEGFWKGLAAAYMDGGFGNGGFFGAFLGDILTKIFGEDGRYIVLIAVSIVSLIFITGRSLAALFLRLYDWIEEKNAESREERARIKEDDRTIENEPAIAVGSMRKKNIRAHALPERPAKRRAFDHVIPAEIDTPKRKVPEERIQLPTEDIKQKENDYYHIFDKKDMAKKRGEETTNKPVREPVEIAAEPVEEPIAEPVVHMNERVEPEQASQSEPEKEPAEDEADKEGISVRGVGIEGYTPMTVDAEGEAFVPTGKAKDRDKIMQEMTAIEQAARGAMNGEAPMVEYELPPMDLLNENPYVPSLSSKAAILENSRKLEETLKSFGVEARVVEVSKGPTVTRYELSPGAGVKVSKISGLADDLALSLAAVGIRIEAPIPGKSVVGIEIPNKEVQSVYLKEVLSDPAFWAHPSKLSFAVGKDIAGNTVIADIARMPHLLIAGATGSGKSVCINTLITSILYKAHPDEVKLLMIDPKVVELSIYNGIPHLIVPVVTDPKKASGALNWAVREMDLRYNMFAETKTRDLKGYNGWREEHGEPPVPQIVVVVDELADLMMTAPGEVEEAICRLAQKARAAGIHLVIATQRPSVDVITGLIKANVPSRLAFAVSSGIDSRTILDSVGAEKLLGKGDMLFSPAGLGKPQRIQGAFISDKEVEHLVGFIKAQGEHEYDPALVEKVTSNVKEETFNDEEDEFLQDAIEYLVEREKASVSNLQRRFRIGYNRASRLMEDLENRGIVGPEDGAKPRKVLMTTYQFMEYKERRESAAAESAMEARQSLLGGGTVNTAQAFAAEPDDDDAPF